MADSLGLIDYVAEVQNDLDGTVLTDNELHGVINEMAGLGANDPNRLEAIRRIQRSASSRSAGVVHTRDLTDRGEFEKRLSFLPASVRRGLAHKRLKIVDAHWYVARSIENLSMDELFKNADTKAPGVTNVNNRKLEAMNWFLLTGITLLSGLGADAKAVAYGIVTDQIANGELKLEVGSRTLLPSFSCRLFDTTNKKNVRKGYFKLDNPKFITPQSEIVAELRLSAAAPATTCVKMILHGVTLEKA
jgi:hypothetical protein